MLVTVYSMPNCPQCTATYKRLEATGIEYETVDVTRDQGAFTKVQGLGYLKAPVVVVSIESETINHWAGFRPDLIKALASQLVAV